MKLENLFTRSQSLLEAGIPIGVLLFGFYSTPFLVNNILPAPFYMEDTRDPNTGMQLFSFVLNKQFIFALVFIGWILGIVTFLLLRKSAELYRPDIPTAVEESDESYREKVRQL